ncbi:MAG: protein kinase domain-containing protein [Planctomycetota bacterium]
MSVAKVGEPAPEFTLRCIRAGDERPRPVRLSDYSGRWLMLIFYPRDFTFVCPTELTAFSARLPDFSQRECELLGISVDSIELHQEWLSTSPADGGLGPLQFPLASDTDGTAARAYGVWLEEKEVSTRGLFVIDPDGVLQYAVLHNLSVGRSPDEVLRVLDALRTGGLCPASWTSADGTIDPEGALQPGKILGHYRIRKQLGVGTFGTVFAAWDLRLERTVALKVLKRKLFESREAALAESRAAARLNDPHVCTLYAVQEEDGLPVIVMEYLDGQPLSQMIADGLSRDSALGLATQIASGLAAAHAQEVVHGDLKPANVMVTKNGIAKILDFGLARPQQALSSGTATAGEPQVTSPVSDVAQVIDGVDATVDYANSAVSDPAGIQGSLAYMSPEQALGLPATPASDVFSFGLTLVEMLTGRRAHTEQSPVKLLVRLQTEDLASELVREVDDAYQDLLLPMLAHTADQRPSMSKVARRVNAIAVL